MRVISEVRFELHIVWSETDECVFLCSEDFAIFEMVIDELMGCIHTSFRNRMLKLVDL